MSFPNSHRSFVSITGLLDDNKNPSSKAITQATGRTTPGKGARLAGHGGIIPLRVTTILVLGITFSLFFILSICFAFMGDDGDEPHFKQTLNAVAQNSPGVSHFGFTALRCACWEFDIYYTPSFRLFCWVRASMLTSTSRLLLFDGPSSVVVMSTYYPTQQGFTEVPVDYLLSLFEYSSTGKECCVLNYLVADFVSCVAAMLKPRQNITQLSCLL